jgi:predicted PP-loop superfamily ATPase
VNKLASLTFTKEGEINEQVASRVLESLTRSQLKAYLAALRREMRRRRVYVALSGGAESDVSGAIGQRYPGRELAVYRDEGLGAGLKVSAGDDIVDASVLGYLKGLLEEIAKG